MWRTGQKQRSRGETTLNASSSRSHSVFTIKLCTRNGVYSKLSLVDLAGAERSTRTGNTGQRMVESKGINTSLMKLGRCLEVTALHAASNADADGCRAYVCADRRYDTISRIRRDRV